MKKYEYMISFNFGEGMGRVFLQRDFKIETIEQIQILDQYLKSDEIDLGIPQELSENVFVSDYKLVREYEAPTTDYTFRKKPVEIQAFRLGYTEFPSWFLNNDRVKDLVVDTTNQLISCDLVTLEGTMKADKGDYIILGVMGEIYPCKANIFEMTYDKV